jgi:hypothetical protein
MYYKGTECYAEEPPTRTFHTQDKIPIAIYICQKPTQIKDEAIIALCTYSSEKAHNTIIFAAIANIRLLATCSPFNLI